jgi:hypothetical protein
MAGIPKKLAERVLAWADACRSWSWARRGLSAFFYAMQLGLLQWRASACRRAGIYDQATLGMFEEIAKRRGRPGDWLDYCSMLRRCGLAISSADFAQLQKASPGLSEFGRDWVRRIGREFRYLEEGAEHMDNPVAAKTCDRQQKFRCDFERTIRQRAVQGGICVVGNSGSLRGKLLGAKIDAHAMVVRFNLCKGSPVEDLGKRLDIWMGSPGFKGLIPLPRVALIISGPEMHWVLRDWTKYDSVFLSGVPILCVPREVWRKGVELVKAPPSAGFLFLLWARQILGGWGGLCIAGMGTTGKFYHQAGPQYPPALHHDFEAEAERINLWLSEGLRRLG